MAKHEKTTASARRVAGVRRKVHRSRGFERLEERTVLSAAGAAVLVYVIDLSDVRGWEPPQISTTPNQGNQVRQKSVMQLDHATVVFVRANSGNRRGPVGGEDPPEGEASAKDPVRTTLLLRASEAPPSSSIRVSDPITSPTTPLLPATNRETPASSGPDGNAMNSVKSPANLLTSLAPVVSVVTSPTVTAARPTLLIMDVDSTSGSPFSESRPRAAARTTVRADSLEQLLGPAGLLDRGGDGSTTGDLVDAQVSYDDGQSSEDVVMDGPVTGDKAWLPISRSMRLRQSMAKRFNSLAVHAVLQRLVDQSPSDVLWGHLVDVDPAAELAEVLTAEAARSVVLANATRCPEDEGGAVVLTTDDCTDSVPERDPATDCDEHPMAGEQVVLLRDIEVRMEFSAERYQAFDVSTEPQQSTDPGRDVAMDSPATGN